MRISDWSSDVCSSDLRREQDKVYHSDFIDALEKIVLGPERPIILSDADRERIAYHEGGHAILGLVVPGADPVHRVTIVPRGQALGVTYQRPQTDRYNRSEEHTSELQSLMRISYADFCLKKKQKHK